MIKKNIFHLHKKPPRWVREQKDRKKQAKSKFRKFFLAVLVLIFILFSGWKIWSWNRQSLWDGRHNFNFVVWIEREFYVISYRTGTEELNVLYIMPETYVPLAKGFGEYPASSIWRLGELEKFGGGKLLQLSSQYFLGVPIQGWGKTSAKFNPPAGGSKLTKSELIWLMINLGLSKDRNLTWWDLLRLVNKARSLPISKINFYALDKTRAGEEVTLPDGLSAFKIQKEFLDGLVKDIYKDMAVLNEGVIWAVINKTDHLGLAAQAVRIIDNIGGGVVVFYDKNNDKEEGIYCQDKAVCQGYTVKLFSQTFKLPVRQEEIEENRAEAVIIFDEPYWQFFYQR